MNKYRILIRRVEHTNVKTFLWHAVLCEDDDPDRISSPAAKIWEADNEKDAFAEYTAPCFKSTPQMT